MKNQQIKAALVNDLSGFGRCSLTVMLPILSAMSVECALLPTALLSAHTAYDSIFKIDLSDEMDAWMDSWKKLNVQFQGIATGWMDSVAQAEKTKEFFHLFGSKNTLILVDPVMADQGRLYSTIDETMPAAMADLAKEAEMITPNLSEACFLLNKEWKESFTRDEIEEMAKLLLTGKTRYLVITGILEGDTIFDLALEKGKEPCWISHPYQKPLRHGTGDVFASVLFGSMLKNLPFEEAVKKAGWFVGRCLEVSSQYKVSEKEGLAFEECLWLLSDRCRHSEEES